MLSACTTDLEGDGVCADAHRNGETMPCLVQRVKPESLSEACQAVLPAQEAVKGLKKFWADGKRTLLIDEIMELNADEKDTYEKWQKKKKGKKTEKDREREYAIKQAKREKTEKRVAEAGAAAAKAALEKGGGDAKKAALEAVEAEWKVAMSEDMTNT